MGRGVRLFYSAWPGLGPAWFDGSWRSLTVAIGFAGLLNFALVATCLWTELVTANMVSTSWLVLGVVWCVSAAMAYRRFPHRASGANAGSGPAGDPFERSVVEYLKGNWFEAEVLLQQALKRNPRDNEAQLLLATLLRRTGRLEESTERLAALERTLDAARWQLEIAAERRYIARQQERSAGGEQHSGDENSGDEPSDEDPHNKLSSAA